MNTVFFGTYEGRLLGYTIHKVDDGYSMMLEYAVETHIGSVKSVAAEVVNGVPYLLSGGADESIRIFDLKEAKEDGTILFHQGDITCLEFAGPEFMISGGADGKIVVWKTDEWTKLHILGSHKASVTSICVHPSNKLALSVGADNTMRMWNLVKGRLGFVRKLKEQPFKISFSPDGAEYAILYSRTCCVYKVADGEQVFQLTNKLGFNDMVIFPNGDLVLVGNDKMIHVFDKKGTETATINANTQFRLRTVTLIPREDATPLIVTGSSDGYIQLWDVYSDGEKLVDEVKTSERLLCSTSVKVNKD
ncbi:hypothetical protein WA538_005504 [Blastocystis sp. DL]